MTARPFVIAHRGASARAPENTAEAFTLAVEMGADGIELDVNATYDGRFAVYHDREVGGRPLAELTLEEVRDRARLPGGTTVPDLEDVLRTFSPAVTLYVEVKSCPPALDSVLIKLLRGAPRPLACPVHGFDHRIVHRLLAAAPDLTGGVLSSSVPVDPVAALRDSGAQTLWQTQDLLDRDLADAVHAAGYHLIAWTVDPAERVAALRDLADGICTNTPDVARKVIG